MDATIRTEQPLSGLSRAEIDRLLRALDFYKTHLNESHGDARRLATGGGRSVYVVDFDLLHHLTETDDTDALVHELEAEHLYHRLDTVFIIGPGTLVELDNALKSILGFHMRYLPDDPMAVEDFLVNVSQRHGPATEHLQNLPYRLKELSESRPSRLASLWTILSQPNFLWFSDLDVELDQRVVTQAKNVLEAHRRSRTGIANLADSLNIALVCALRSSEASRDFPFLLTGTKLILHQEWNALPAVAQVLPEDEPSEPFGRAVETALYSSVLLDLIEEPLAARQAAVDRAFLVARLERDLLLSPGYLHDRVEQRFSKSTFLADVRDKGVTAAFLTQLDELSQFVSDPVVRAMQAMQDSVRLGATNLARQRGVAPPPDVESPQQLFDLLVGLATTLRREASQFSEAWTGFIASQVDRSGPTVRKTFRDTSAPLFTPHFDDQGLYLACEYVCDDPDGGYFVFRWPCVRDVQKALTILSWSFYRHHIDVVDVVVGAAEEEPVYLESDMPLDYTELASAVPGHDIHWLRLGCPEFDFFLDVIPAPLSSPVLGVFARRPNAEHLLDLYAETSLRYLHPEWLGSILSSCLDLPNCDEATDGYSI